ncbi:putative carbohydrate-binding protein with starch-binding CBM53 [Ruminiclostridium sufflavum DSM 19573]|uniref:Putative carbohydrate-binding protein with starch-binding CBM53 n=1 Tax=Ruminiclostridium sufflavum DSM 19573 TaxID=1121337 RepID=A0A318XP85_9FIRM|nr:carbohydrate-binding protein [Ruminiclostridium sufflavum]PYG88865.1 putative carbohydrate-binding protein with starch-binding CBM53 [Ruminiclostridium sufflavum DSM 19573]
MAKKSYDENGVLLSKKTLYSGDIIMVSYTGLLVQSGAQDVFLHIGFGDEWENSSFIPMKYEEGTFIAEFEIQECKKFGICFKDTAENWDNNTGENYVFSVSQKPLKKDTAAKKEKSTTEKAPKTKAKAKTKL